jgi:hypothetical protein
MRHGIVWTSQYRMVVCPSGGMNESIQQIDSKNSSLRMRQSDRQDVTAVLFLRPVDETPLIHSKTKPSECLEIFDATGYGNIE